MKKVCLFIIYLFVLVACDQNSQKEKQEGAIFIDIDNLKELSFYDIFTKVELFPLETKNESLIQNIDKVVMHNGLFYILDEMLKVILVFDQEGGYVRMINKHGNGPGEYTEINDFRFSNGDLELLSPMAGIYVYDTLGITYKHCIRLPHTLLAAHYFVDIASEEYLFFSNSAKDDKMFFYNSKLDTITGRTYNMPKYLLMSTLYHHNYSPFYDYNGIPHFVQGHDGAVFILEDGELLPKYQWDFGEYNFELENLTPDKDIRYYLMYHQITGKKYASIFITYCENSRYYATQFCLKNKIYKLFYDKVNQYPVVFNRFKEVDIVAPKILDESFAYSIVSSEALDRFINPDLLDEDNKKRYDSVNPDSNPIIIRYTFKK